MESKIVVGMKESIPKRERRTTARGETAGATRARRDLRGYGCDIRIRGLLAHPCRLMARPRRGRSRHQPLGRSSKGDAHGSDTVSAAVSAGNAVSTGNAPGFELGVLG